MSEQDPFELFQESYHRQIQELTGNFSLVEPQTVRQAIRLIMAAKGKLILTGMGKSGLIAQKLAATFSSTGTPAFFLHPGESLHGDLGVIQDGDVLLILAKSGESDEVVQMLQVVRKMNVPVISVLGKKESTVGRMSDVVINSVVSREADPLNLAPTASTTVALVVGDALATAISEIRGFQPENFALVHPAGQLGKRLLLNVEDFLLKDQEAPLVQESDSIPHLLEIQERPNLGGVIVVGEDGKIRGLVTDGDLRRAVRKYGNVLDKSIPEIMTKNPITIHAQSKAIEALRIMEDRPSQISVLPVVDENNFPVGLLRIHDLVRAGL